MKSIIKLCKQGIKPREYILLPHIGANVHWEIINHQKQIGGIWLYMVLTLTKLDALSFRIKVPLHDVVKKTSFSCHRILRLIVHAQWYNENEQL